MLKFICIMTLSIQPLFAAHGDGRANMDRQQERYEDDKPTLYDLNQGDFNDDEPNWNRTDRQQDQAEGGSCSDGSCKRHHKLIIEDD